MNKKLKNTLITIVILTLCTLAALLILKLGGNKLDKPESIVYDPIGDRFLISNTGSGSIVAMDSKGKYKDYLPKAFNSPKGMALRDDMLFVCEPNRIVAVDVSEAKIVDKYEISGARALNDIALDEYGKIYSTDTEMNCVWIYNPKDGSTEKVTSPLFKKPNGIYYDRPRWQMFVVNFAERSPILSLDVRDNQVSIFMDSVYSQLDGIAEDDWGRLFISSWAEEMIIEIPQEQNRFLVRKTGLKSPADLYYHLPTNELLVPLHHKNKIERIQLDRQ